MSVRIWWFPIFILMPFRCVNEVLEGFMDILWLFRRVSKKAFSALYTVENAIMLVQDYGPLDIVDVNVRSKDARVKVKVLLR
jgi:hypothetical protein